MANEILYLDTAVTADFIYCEASAKGATRSTGTHLFLNDQLIACRDHDGQIYVGRKGMNTEAEAILSGTED
jgi:hypothetical protein